MSQNVGISHWEDLVIPNFKGFEPEAIDVTPMEVHNGLYKGEKYRYVVLSKFKLNPKEKGKFQVEPLSLIVTIESPSEKRSEDGKFEMNRVKERVKSEPITIIVN